jgi:hypothetical protein
MMYVCYNISEARDFVNTAYPVEPMLNAGARYAKLPMKEFVKELISLSPNELWTREDAASCLDVS